MSEHGGNIIEVAEQLGISPASLFDFSANINPLGAPARIKTLLVDNLHQIERYPDIEYRHLHQALAQANYCSINHVIAGNGATELIYALIRCLKPKRAMLLTPSFAEYRRALLRAECEIIDYPMLESDNFQPDERLLAKLKHDKPDCLFITTPNNPTGLMPDEALLSAIIHFCEQQQTHLIVDEAFIDFLPQGSQITQYLLTAKYLFILRSLTKFFAIPGLRLGYLLSGNQAVITMMKEQREPWSINALSALVGEHLLNDYDYIRNSWRAIKKHRDYLYRELAALPALTLWQPSANYLFFRCLTEIDLQQALLKYKILIRHCKNYPGLTQHHYRIAVRSAPENQRLVNALKQVLSDG